MRVAHDRDIKNKEAELATLKGKLKVLEQSSGAGAKRIADLKQEYEETVKSKWRIFRCENSNPNIFVQFSRNYIIIIS